MVPRRVGYFISGSSRLSGDLGEYAVEGERVFESPEKPFTTTDLVPAGALNSDVAMFPQNASEWTIITSPIAISSAETTIL